MTRASFDSFPQGVSAPLCASGPRWAWAASWCVLAFTLLPGCGGSSGARCGEGTYDADPTGATLCIAHTSCAPGTYVSRAPDDEHDRECSACPASSFSGDTNSASCTPHLPCAAGLHLITPATATAQTVCEACDAGTYCAGGASEPVTCGGATATWDHDANPSTPCQAHRDCSTGEHVTAAGDAVTDRACALCATGTYTSTTNAAACTPHRVCDPGAFVAVAGSATADQVCAPCPSGTFSVADDAAECTAWRTCAAGTFVSAAGTLVADRECTVCEGGTHTTGPNQTLCIENGACVPGTYQVVPGSNTAPPTCADCTAGEHCAGGTTPRVACNEGDATWDADADPATACTPRSTCGAGTFVATEGDALNDRECDACESETFSEGSNAATCVAWSTCGVEEVESVPPSAVADRVCEPDWLRQFGTSAGDRALAVDTDAAGNVFAAGYSSANLYGTNAGQADVWVGKWDRLGNPLWGDQFGSNQADAVTDVVVDAAGDVYITGYVLRALPDQTWHGGFDAYLRKYSSDGDVLWTRQFGSAMDETGYRLHVGAGGQLYLAGTTYTSPGTPDASLDAFVTLFDAEGTALWTAPIRSPGADYPADLAVDADGNVYVAGTAGGALTGETSAGGSDAYLVKLDANGQELFRRQFGTSTDDQAYGLALSAGGVTLTGRAGGALGGPSAGSGDVFVRHYDATGDALWTTQFGSSLDDHPMGGIAVAPDGTIYVGGYTGGGLPGHSSAGWFDFFAARLSATGTLQVVRQVGSNIQDQANAMNVESSGAIVLVGYTAGTLPGQSSTGGDDAFIARFGAL